MPIGRAAKRAMKEYLEARETLAPVTDDLWVTERGKAMQPAWIPQLFERLKERAGISRLHPHIFRHAYATNTLRGGMPEQVLKIIWVGRRSRIPALACDGGNLNPVPVRKGGRQTANGGKKARSE